MLEPTKRDSDVERADLDWEHLEFGFLETDCNIRYTWRDGKWSDGELTPDLTIPVHIAATCLHYGQQCFEGLKAFEQRNGDIVVFRDRHHLTASYMEHLAEPVANLLEGRAPFPTPLPSLLPTEDGRAENAG